MRFRFTIILVILNLLALGSLYLLELRTSPLKDFSESSSQFFLNGVHIDKLKIDIDSPNLKETRVIEKDRKHWNIVEPFFWPANESAVYRIISQLEFLQKRVTIPLSEIKKSNQTLADYGLEKPKITLTFWSGNKKTTLKIGATTQMGNRLYVLSPDGNEVVVVDSSLLKSLDISLKDLRKAQIFDIPVFEIKSFRIQEGDRRILLEKKDENWEFAAPISVSADDKLVVNALGLMDAAQVVSIIPTKGTHYERMKLHQPFMRITLSNHQRRNTLVIGAPVESGDGKPSQDLRYAMLETGDKEGTVITVKAGDFEWLKDALDALRERQFMDITPSAISSINIFQGSKELRLQKLEREGPQSTGSWQVLNIKKQGAAPAINGDTKVIQDLLVDLEELEAQKFVSDVSMQGDMSKYGLAHPNAVVEVNGKEKRTLLFGNVLAEDPRLMYAKRADQPFIYAIWSRFLADVTVNPLNYKDRVLIQLPKTAKIVGLKITDLETERVIIDKSINPKTTTWSTELKDEPEERRLALLNIIAASKSFKVAQYISSRFEDIKDLPWRYHMEVRVALPGASDEQIQHNDYFFTFRIRANRQMGGSPQANADFSLPQSFIDALFSVTFELEQPELPRNPQALESVNVEAIPKEPSARGPLPGAFLPSDIVKEKK